MRPYDQTDALSQPGYDVRFVHDMRIPMSDGTELSADAFLPRGSGPFPTLLHRTPYESSFEPWMKWGIWWAKRGYAAVSQDCRGRYESQGFFNPYIDEASDGRDTIAWLADQPWCSGRIGTWGRSYGALTQWRLAPGADESLTCMAPHAIGDSYFETLHYPGGAFQLALSLVSAVMFSATVGTVIYDQGTIFTRDLFRHLPLIDLDVQAIGREIPFWRDWLAHPTYDDYWQAITHRHAYERIDVPIFQQSGWYDPYVAGMFRMQQAMIEQGGSPRARKHQKVLIGPWTHSEPASSCLGDLDFGPSARVVFPELELPWFDYWLKGIDTGIAEQPPICIFVMGFNRWRFESEWPLDRAEPTPYYLRSNGRANSIYGDGVLSRELPASEPPDHFDYDPANPVPTLGGVHSLGYAMQNSPDPVLVGPVDQRPIARRDDVLVYTTRPLERAVEATGPIEFVLYAASSALDTDFTVSLLDVGPTGFSVPVSEGIIRGRYRLGFDQMEFLERDEPTEFRIQMSPTSNVFQKGHRIRVHVSSSNFPHFSRNLNTGENVATSVRMRVAHQTVLHSSDFPSHIVLPLVPIDGPEGAG